MVFDRRQSVIFGYHLIKSVASSNIFSFSLAVKRLTILILFLFFFCFVYFLLMPNVSFFTFLSVIITVKKICLHKFNIFCFFRFLEKLQNG